MWKSTKDIDLGIVDEHMGKIRKGVDELNKLITQATDMDLYVKVTTFPDKSGDVKGDVINTLVEVDFWMKLR